MKAISKLGTISVSKELIDASKGNLTLGVVTANVQVKKFDEGLWNLMQECCGSKKKYDQNKIDVIPEIKALRDTYKTLGLKISDYKGSNEALLKRVVSDKGLYQINTVVDVNNYISLESMRSIGSYDLSKLSGNIVFRKGLEGESYLGTTKRAVQLKNLPVLCDDQGPFGSPTSDSSRALIQDATTDVITIIFSFDGATNLNNHVYAIRDLFKKYANATNVNTYLVQDKPRELVLSDKSIDLDIVQKLDDKKEIIQKFKNIERLDNKSKDDKGAFDAVKYKEYKANVSGYKVIEDKESHVPICFVGLNKKLTGEMHVDASNLNTVEYFVNLFKFFGIIKNEPTKVIGDKSLNFAYNNVQLNYKAEGLGNVKVESSKNPPSLNLKICDDHFELFLSNMEDKSSLNEYMTKLCGILEGNDFTDNVKKNTKDEEQKDDKEAFDAVKYKEYKANISPYKVIEYEGGQVKSCSVSFKKKLTGEMHSDATNLNTIEYFVNLFKFFGIIKNEPTKVNGDKSLNFAYNNVQLNYKAEGLGNVKVESSKNPPSLNLKICDDHFELFLSNMEDKSSLNEYMTKLCGVLDSENPLL